MDRDVVYIEPDDDITTVVEQIGEAEADSVAIVAPKRSSLLQSAVNLKLLRKRAESSGKDLSLVTSDNVVNNIAARLGLPTAGNLKDEPAVPQPAGGSSSDLPQTTISEQEFSDQTKTAQTEPSTETKKSPFGFLKSDSEDKGQDKIKDKTSSKFNVPNFDKFKKRLFLGGGALLLLAIGWWVATFLLPSATVTLQAQSESLGVSGEMAVDTTQENIDLENGVLPATSQEMTKTLVTSFQPSGEKEVGEKATGTITVRNCDDTNSRSIPAGTAFKPNSNGNLTFRNNSSFEVPSGEFDDGGLTCTSESVSAAVTADKIGEQYNIGSENYTISGYEELNATGSDMTGGSKKTVSVVTQNDIKQARKQLLNNERSNARQELLQRFEDDVHILEPSFTQNVQSANPQPAAGEEADSGQLTLEVRYFAFAVAQEQLQTFLAAKVEDQLKSQDNTQSEVVELNLENVSLKLKNKPKPNRQVYSFNHQVQIGPRVDNAALSKELAGREYGQALEELKARPHITDASVDLSPFWVFTLPDNPEQIEIKLNLTQSE